MRSLSSLKIAVQNASGQMNLSREVANKLKAQGLENVYVSADWQDKLSKIGNFKL